MVVPEDIRAVQKPVNTIVDDSVRDDPKRFAVKQRAVIGAEFVNFLSTVATCRIVRKARQAGLPDKMTYGFHLTMNTLGFSCILPTVRRIFTR